MKKDEQENTVPGVERENAKRAIDRMVREFEEKLLAPIDTDTDAGADDAPISPSHTLIGGNAADAQAAERKKRETVEFLRAAGVGKRKAVWLAEQFPDAPTDARTREAVRSAQEIARGLSRLKARMTDHSGHRRRLRISAERDPELDAFSDIEIAETLLSYFVPRKDVNPLAHELLDAYGSLIGIVRRPSAELRRFRNMTDACAELLPMLSSVCLWDGVCDISLRSPRDAADFFGSLYHGGTVGTRVAFLDGRLGLAAIERPVGKKFIDGRQIVGSIGKYSAKYVIISSRVDGFSEEVFGLAAQAAELGKTLAMVGAQLLDLLLFTSRGYYSLGATRSDPEIFMFTPIARTCAAPGFKRAMAEIAEDAYIMTK